jgi:hypothetical protein
MSGTNRNSLDEIYYFPIYAVKLRSRGVVKLAGFGLVDRCLASWYTKLMPIRLSVQTAREDSILCMSTVDQPRLELFSGLKDLPR